MLNAAAPCVGCGHDRAEPHAGGPTAVEAAQVFARTDYLAMFGGTGQK